MLFSQYTVLLAITSYAQHNINNGLITLHCGLVVITTAQLHSTKLELRLNASSSHAYGVSGIRNGEDL